MAASDSQLPEAARTTDASPDSAALSPDSAPIQKLARAILVRAIRLDAGYLFVQPGAYDAVVGYRTLTGMQLEPELPWRVAEPLLLRYRQLAGLDSEPGTRVRSGSWRLRARGKLYRVSATFVPCLQGEVLGLELREIYSRDTGANRPAGFTAIKQAYKSVFRPRQQG